MLSQYLIVQLTFVFPEVPHSALYSWFFKIYLLHFFGILSFYLTSYTKTLAITTKRNEGHSRKTNLLTKYRLGYIRLDYCPNLMKCNMIILKSQWIWIVLNKQRSVRDCSESNIRTERLLRFEMLQKELGFIRNKYLKTSSGSVL